MLVGGLGETLGSVARWSASAPCSASWSSIPAAHALAESMVATFGEKRAPFALGLASLLVGFPI